MTVFTINMCQILYGILTIENLFDIHLKLNLTGHTVFSFTKFWHHYPVISMDLF